MGARFWTVLLAGLILVCHPALAEKRVALVIGNSAYGNVPKLINPVNDAEAVGLLLRRAGFDVIETRRDLGIGDMRRAVRDFSDMTQGADIAVVFYAGHGIEVDGANYLVPVDARLERDLDVEDETISLDRVLKVLEPAKRLRLVILDACRDNPFAKTMKRTIASRAIGRGLAGVEPVTSNTLIAFAAKAGSTAADGDTVHSPFTAAVLQHIATPGLDLRIAFGRVRDQVFKNTRSRQEPFVYGSLGGSNVSFVSLTPDERIETRSDTADSQAARDYEFAAKLATQQAWDSFLVKYPTGFYSDLARGQRDKLNVAKPPSKVTAVPPSGQSEQEERSKPTGPVRQKENTKVNTKQKVASGQNMTCCMRYMRTQSHLTEGDWIKGCRVSVHRYDYCESNTRRGVR